MPWQHSIITYPVEEEAKTPISALPVLSKLFKDHKEVADFAVTVKDFKRTNECDGPQTPRQSTGPSRSLSLVGFIVNDDAPAASSNSLAVL